MIVQIALGILLAFAAFMGLGIAFALILAFIEKFRSLTGI